jgi:hypothetical protein
MTITPVTSEHPQTCWVCSQLGLPAEGIEAGEEHLLIVAGDKSDRSCRDCFVRLQDEVAAQNMDLQLEDE